MILEHKNQSEVDVSDWDIDNDTGTLAHVVWPIKDGDLYEVETKIECEVNQWVKENIEGDCFYVYEGGEKPFSRKSHKINRKKHKSHNEVVFYFKKVEDAFLFKLTWG